MNWHHLDLALLALIIASLFWRKYIYRYLFRGVRDKVIDSCINRKANIAIIIIVANFLIFLAEAVGALSTRSFWVVMVALVAPAMVCLYFFLAREITLIRERRWTTQFRPHDT